MKKFALAALFGLGGTIAGVPLAVAGDTVCMGLLSGPHDNVVVREGTFCNIVNAQIKGNVKALPNSTLLISGGTTVGGNVEADKAINVQIFGLGNVVNGNIQAKEGGTGVTGISVCGVLLPEGNVQIEKFNGGIFVGGPGCAPFGGGNVLRKGNIKVEENVITPAFGLQVGNNSVTQNVQVFKNRGPGAKSVQNNTVDDTLQCFENDPPFVGGPNAAAKAEGQCF